MEFFESLLAVIAPHSCINCNNEGGLLCEACTERLPAKRPTCYSCNRLSEGGRTCPACLRHTALSGVVVAHRYDGAVKELVRALKYDNKVAVSKTFEQMLSPLLVPSKVEGLSPANYDFVTAIPGAPSRYRHRGYHQAELIAKRVARALGLPYRRVLGRLEVDSQVGSSRGQRFLRVKDSFWVRRPESVIGQRVLIIDDVLTTGATLGEAARVLKAAGAKSVWGAVVAKH